MIEYRGATVDDLVPIVSLIEEMHTETSWGGDPKFKFKPKDMALHVLGYIENQPESFAEIAVKEGRIVGVILGDYGHMIFNRSVRQAREKLVYVVPHLRGGMVGPRLMKSFVKWAKSTGAAEIIGGANAGISPERTQKLWSLLGLAPFGYTVRARV